jgi:hypothetical protein
MSGRGGRNSGRGGRVNSGRGCGCGQNYTGATNESKRALCTNFGINVFDYGQKSAADQMRTSWEKLVQYVGTNYGQDISNELQNKVTVTLVEPVHTKEVLTTRRTITDDQKWSDKLATGTKSPTGYPVNGSECRNGFGRTHEASNPTERDCTGRVRGQC